MFFKKPSQNDKIAAPIKFHDDWDAAENSETFAIVEAEEGEIPGTADVIKVTDDVGDVDDVEAEENIFTEDPVNGNGNDDGVETRSGCPVNKPTRLIEEMGATVHDIGLSAAEERYYNTMWRLSEHGLVGAGIGGGFVDTSELHVMKYKEAMRGADASKWQKAVDKEHDRMLKHNVWEPVLKKDLPDNSKVLISTWAMK